MIGKGKLFQCEITVSPGVEEKLFHKHHIEMWEIEEVIYDDPDAFSIAYRDCYFIYGRTFSGRYLLVLVRILSVAEISKLFLEAKANVLKIITARDMNRNQKNAYNQRKKTR